MNLIQLASRETGKNEARLIWEAYVYNETPLCLQSLLAVVNNYHWHGKTTMVVQDFCLKLLADTAKNKRLKGCKLV